MKNGNLEAIVLALLAAIIFPGTVAGQQASQKACSLLTPGEWSAAVGGTVAHASETQTAYKKSGHIDHDGILYECHATVGGRKVIIRFTTAGITAEGKKAGRNVSADAQKWMIDQGYKIEVKEIGPSHCTTIVPRPVKGVEGDVGTTTCLLDNGVYLVSITVNASPSGDLLPMEKLATLAEKAATRFPAR